MFLILLVCSVVFFVLLIVSGLIFVAFFPFVLVLLRLLGCSLFVPFVLLILFLFLLPQNKNMVVSHKCLLLRYLIYLRTVLMIGGYSL